MGMQGCEGGYEAPIWVLGALSCVGVKASGELDGVVEAPQEVTKKGRCWAASISG